MRQPHAIEHHARKQGHGVPVAVGAADAAALLATGEYTRSVGLDVHATHWRGPGGLHLSHAPPSDGLATGSDGAAIVADDPATSSDAGTGTGGGGDGGWSLHVDKHDPHAGPGSALAHVATETGAVGPAVLLLALLAPVGIYFFTRRGKR